MGDVQIHSTMRLHATNLLGEECYAVLSSTSPSTSRGPCLRLLLSKLLGSIVVLGGSIFKLPQIYKILSARSARGISLATYVLECFVYATNLAYSWRRDLPITTYGEQMSLTMQNMFITLLIIRYDCGRGATAARQRSSSQSSISSTLPLAHNQRKTRLTLLLALLAMILGSSALFSPGIVSDPMLGWLQATTVPADLASKVPQIRRLYQDKATGQLSALLVFLQLAGTLARCFTTATETGDHQMLLGYALAALFNGAIAAQYIYYWRGDQRRGYKSLSSLGAASEEGAEGSDQVLALLPPDHLPRQVRRKERRNRGQSMDERRQSHSLFGPGPESPPRRSYQLQRTSTTDRPSHDFGHGDPYVSLVMPTNPETAAFEMGRVERAGIKRD